MSALSERYWTEHLGPLPEAERREARAVRRLVTCQIGARRWEEGRARGLALPLREGIRLGTLS